MTRHLLRDDDLTPDEQREVLDLADTVKAEPFASVTTSGTTPAAWWANQRPVRPIPVCTSSRTSSAPRSAVNRRAAAR